MSDQGGSAEGLQGNVAQETGGSVEPPTSTPVDPQGGSTPCIGLNTPDGQLATIGMKMVDNAIWTTDNREQCIIYTDTLTSEIPDFVLQDDIGTEYRVTGAPKDTAILWYNRISSGSFNHQKSIPVFGGEPGALAVFKNAFAPRVDNVQHKSKITLTYWTNVDGELGSIGVRQGGFLCTASEVGQPTPVGEHEDTTSPVVSKPTGKSKQMNRSLMITNGEPKRILFKNEENLTYSIAYIFDTPTQLMEKKGGINEYDLSLSAASGVICDTDRPDGESNSTIVYAGDCVNHGDFDDLTVVAPFVGGSKGGGAAGVPPTKSSEIEQGSVAPPTNAVTSVPVQAGGSGAGVSRWMLWLNQNLNYQGQGTARGGMVYQTAQLGSSFAKRQKVDPTTGKVKPADSVGKKCKING